MDLLVQPGVGRPGRHSCRLAQPARPAGSGRQDLLCLWRALDGLLVSNATLAGQQRR